MDDDTLLALLAFGLFHSRLSLDQIKSELFKRFWARSWEEMTPLQKKMYCSSMSWIGTKGKRGGLVRLCCDHTLRRENALWMVSQTASDNPVAGGSVRGGWGFRREPNRGFA